MTLNPKDPNGKLRNIFKLSLKGCNEYRLIAITGNKSTAKSYFLRTCKKMLYATSNTKALKYKRWVTYNRSKLMLKNVTCELILDGIIPGVAKVFVHEYLKEEPNKYLILNHRGI